jgi:hypothetical protein
MRAVLSPVLPPQTVGWAALALRIYVENGAGQISTSMLSLQLHSVKLNYGPHLCQNALPLLDLCRLFHSAAHRPSIPL